MTKQKRQWNIGIIVFLVLFIYLMIHVIGYIAKDKLSVYRVSEDKITETISLTGIAIRDEQLVTADTKGYVTFYVEDGERIKKNGTIFLVDKEGTLQSLLEKAEGKKTTTNDNSVIDRTVSDFQTVYNDDNFGATYDLKYRLKNDILNMNEDTIQDLVNQVSANSKDFSTKKSNYSGVVSFYSDSFDEKDADDITEEDFEEESYQKTKWTTADQVKKGDVICRINKSEDWEIVGVIDKEQYEQIKDREKVRIKFKEDEIETTAEVSVKKKKNTYYLYLKLDGYSVRYLDERYLDIDLILESYSGLRIPNSSIVYKNFYRVPVSYISKGNNNQSDGFSVRTTNKDGEVKVEQQNYTIYNQDENYCYLDPNDVEEGTVLQSMDSGDTYRLEKKVKLPGVYCTNQGYSEFKLIQITKKESNYSIIEKNTPDGIEAYDYIVLDHNTIKENQIIY